MANEEEPTLRDMVSQTLDARGVLPKIRAELRANVFLALEGTPNFKELLHENNELSKYAQTENGSIVLNLIREFLQFFNLDFSLSVFNPETRCNLLYNETNRTQLLKLLGIDENVKLPLLCQVLNIVQNGNSPGAGLNSTYTKNNVSFDGSPVKETSVAPDMDDDHSTISTESISEMSPKDENGSEKSESANENSISGRCTPTNEKPDTSINLLVFTPVQEVTTVPKTDKKELQEKKSRESSLVEIIDKQKTSLSNGEGKKISLLNDLPPLGSVPSLTHRQQNMNEIRKLLEKGLLSQEELSNYSQSTKSNKSKSCEKQKDSSNHSDDNTVDDDDISELLNSHASDGQLTEDETISKLSNFNTLDHVESV